MSRLYARGPARMEANLTPLIDMAFLLIVFFVLVSQISSIENLPLELPRPSDNAARRPGDDPRVVVNVVPAADGAAAGYQLGRSEFAASTAGLAQLAKTISEAMRKQPATEINVRADRSTEFRWVQPVLDAVSNALVESGISRERARVKLVVLGGPGA
ncbi:MAG: biopolymer transporter ExbD [Phycisphaerae bacterium]|nr:biopolymer transporter ExbD [Phycisphaerae bacterium]